MLRAISVSHDKDQTADTVTLAYDDRFRRRMTMTADGGLSFLLDLPNAVELADGDTLVLEDGRRVGVRAADEPLLHASHTDRHDLMRAAWHVGNRHLPCQITENALILRWDHVIAEMLEGLGCTVTRQTGPFTPEGGAYGHGRTHGHQH